MTFLVLQNARRHSPAAWPWLPLRRVATIRRDANLSGDVPLLALSANRGIEARAEDGGRQPASENTILGYWRVEPNDLVFNPMWALEGGVAVSRLRGAVSTAYRVYQLSQRVHPPFLHHFTRCQAALDQYRALVRGVTTFDRSVTREDFEAMPVPVPPISQQRLIAAFLDSEASRIDTLIEMKRRVLGLLIDRRLELQNEAFNGLPGWHLKRLLRSRMAYGVLVPRFVEPGEGARMIRINAITPDGRIVEGRLPWIEAKQSHEYRRTVVASGDVVLSVVGSMGRSAVVDASCAGANLNRPLARLQPRTGLPPRLLWHWTQSRQFLDQAQLSTGGDTAQPTLNLSDLADFRVGLPGEPAKWKGILEGLERVLRPVDRAEKLTTEQIALLQEHRQALITAAVTGELSIPGVAA